MSRHYKKYRRFAIWVSVVCVCVLVGIRYVTANSFYIGYPDGKRQSLKRLFNKSVRYQDCKIAGIKEAKLNPDSISHTAYFLELKSRGNEYLFSDGGNEVVVTVTKGNNSNFTIIGIFYDKDDVEVIRKSNANTKQVKEYSKESLKFLYATEDRLYKYWENDWTLKYRKMIPFYGYFQKRQHG